jgi:regulatory protein
MSSDVGDGSEVEPDDRSRLAPVTYLPGVIPADDAPVRWAIPLEGSLDQVSARPGDGPDGPTAQGGLDADAVDEVQAAEDALTRRLRRSALSEREARTFLLQRGIGGPAVEAAIDLFLSRGWIDDAVLAEQLVYAGTTRKGQGRRAIAQSLSGRGIDRDVIDAALAALPDDDDERALEYARSKAHGLRDQDFDTALRRLVGQLARRGYSGSVAGTAARTALTEQRDGGGVQFR